MPDSATNPYRPPASTDSSLSHGVPLVRSIAGTAMVLAIALVLWILVVQIFDGRVPRQFNMVLWTVSLLTSLAFSAFVIARTARFRPRLLHIGIGAFAAIAAYAWLEGSAPGAGGFLHAALFYSSFVLTPLVLVAVTALTPDHSSRTRDGG